MAASREALEQEIERLVHRYRQLQEEEKKVRGAIETALKEYQDHLSHSADVHIP